MNDLPEQPNSPVPGAPEPDIFPHEPLPGEIPGHSQEPEVPPPGEGDIDILPPLEIDPGAPIPEIPAQPTFPET